MSDDGITSGARLTGNAAWSLAGTVYFTAGQIFSVVVLTKSFSSEQVGQILLAMAVITPISFLVNMELRSVYVTDTRQRVTPEACLRLRIFTNALLMLFLLILCGWLGSGWSLQKKAVMLLMGLVRASESWADIYFGVFQKNEKMKIWAFSRMTKVTLIFLWALVLPHVSSSVVWFPVGWFVVVTGMAWFYDRPLARRFYEPADPGSAEHWNWRPVLKSGFVLGLFCSLSIMNHHVPQYFVAGYLGDTFVAYLGVLLLFVNGMVNLQNSVNHAVLSRLAVYYQQNRRMFLGLVGKLMALSGSGAALGLIVVMWRGEWILATFYSEEYAKLSDLFVLVFLAGVILLLGMILGDAVVACHKFNGRLFAMIAGLVVNIAVCYLYLEDYGLAAAAWAMLCSAITVTVLCGGVLIWQLRKTRSS